MFRAGVSLTLALVFGTGVFGAYRLLLHGALASPDRPPGTASVSLETIRTRLRLVGEAQPDQLVHLRSETSGLAAEVLAAIGDEVKEGDLLVRLDDELLRNEKRRLEIELSNAELVAARARRDYESAKGLEESGQGYVSRDETLDREAEHRIAINTIRRIEMQMEDVVEKLRRVRIASPITGTILERWIEPGEVVTGAGAFSGATVLMKIADLTKLVIETEVNEADRPKIAVGTEGHVTSSVVRDLRLRCSVAKIYPVASKGTAGARSFRAEIDLLETDPRLKPGMTAEVIIPLEEAASVVAVPIQAVFAREGRRVVYRLVPGKREPEEVTVEVGLSDARFCEVRAGLRPGDTVLLEPPGEDEPAAPLGKVHKTK